MSESTEQFSAETVKWVIGLFSQNLSRDIDSLKIDLRGDIARVEKGLEKVMTDMVTRKELEEVKKELGEAKEELKSVKKQINDKETAFGIITAIKNNYKFLSILVVLACSVFGSAYWIVDDVHSHYGMTEHSEHKK